MWVLKNRKERKNAPLTKSNKINIQLYLFFLFILDGLINFILVLGII